MPLCTNAMSNITDAAQADAGNNYSQHVPGVRPAAAGRPLQASTLLQPVRSFRSVHSLLCRTPGADASAFASCLEASISNKT